MPVRYTIGCVCLVLVVLSWVMEAELLQGLQEPGSSQYYNQVNYGLRWPFGTRLTPCSPTS